jgi:hypothetical protein
MKVITYAVKIKHFEQKIAYLNQENEFLKNIQVDQQASLEYKQKQ